MLVSSHEACFAERLNIVPTQFRAVVVRRPKYACRTEGTFAQVLVSKYADHLSLYRQAQICGRQASSWIARHWPTGLDVQPFCCARFISGCSID
jgi:transposase